MSWLIYCNFLIFSLLAFWIAIKPSATVILFLLIFTFITPIGGSLGQLIQLNGITVFQVFFLDLHNDPNTGSTDIHQISRRIYPTIYYFFLVAVIILYLMINLYTGDYSTKNILKDILVFVNIFIFPVVFYSLLRDSSGTTLPASKDISKIFQYTIVLCSLIYLLIQVFNVEAKLTNDEFLLYEVSDDFLWARIIWCSDSGRYF